MSRFKKRLFTIIAIIVLVFSVSMLANAATNSNIETKKDIPIFLKLGKYSILYTYPKEPFAVNNRLMITAKSVQDLMGGEVSYNNTDKIVKIKWQGHDFEFTVDSYKATVDGKGKTIDVKPIIIKKSVCIPIYILLHNSDTKWNWDQKLHQLTINDERAVVGTPFNDFIGNDFAGEIKDNNVFHLISYSLMPDDQYPKISITAQNISGHDIAEGKGDIHPLVSFINGGYSSDSYTKRINPLLPMVKKGHIVTKTDLIALDDVGYIICVGREME